MVNILGNSTVATIVTLAEYETRLKKHVPKSYTSKTWIAMFLPDDEMEVRLHACPGDSLKVHATVAGQYVDSQHLGDFVRVRAVDMFNNNILPPQQSRYMLISGGGKIASMSHGCQNILVPDGHPPKNEIRVFLEVNATSRDTRTWWGHSCGIQVAHTRKVTI